MVQYETVIGLEVHVELKTNTKIFCSCSTAFGAEPNHQVCPVCLGLPGALPVLNSQAITYGIMAGLALNCNIADVTSFDRKHYFYPDLPTGYQISQLDRPVAQHGFLAITTPEGEKEIRINRAHLEEDAGKLVHQDTIVTSHYSLVDCNRAGTPLIEIVSEPDLNSADEAVAYLEKLRAIMQYIGVSDCKMEEGSLRCDANISIKPAGQAELGTKTELKNMNSFKALHRAINYEIQRQIDAVSQGEQIVQETRTWDETQGMTLSMRSKEQALDYRYFPDPDLPVTVIDEAWVQQIKDSLPELPDHRKNRYLQHFKLPEYDAGVITASKGLADFFEDCVQNYQDPKIVSNWVMGELLRMMNAADVPIEEIKIKPQELAELLKLMDQGTISGKMAKGVFEDMFNTGKDPEVIIEEQGLKQISDTGLIEKVVDEVIAQNPKSVADYRAGKKKALGFLVGQVMKQTKGQANPGLVNQMLQNKL